MSASDAMRACVRGLMAEAEKLFSGKAVLSTDLTNFCYAFAVDACPAELLYGTKFSLGRCRWSHDEFLRNSIPASEIGRVELGALRVIESALEKLNRQEKKYRKELNHHADLQLVKGEHDILLKAKEARYAREIDVLLQEAKRFGEDEKIEDALKVMENVHETRMRLKSVIAKIKHRQEADARRESLMKLAVNVCNECGIAFGLDNTTIRLQAHLEGKMHKSVCILRKTVEDLRAKYSVTGRRISGSEVVAKQARPSLVSTLREDYERECSGG